jgi:RNA polymerase sigma-70 factor (ECF subfamily)
VVVAASTPCSWRSCIDALRARERRARISEVIPDEAVDRNAAELFDEVADALTHQRVVACMESLPAEQKLAIEFAYFGGLTHAEISEKTGTPIGTVKSRLRLGLLRLRADFGISEMKAQEALWVAMKFAI